MLIKLGKFCTVSWLILGICQNANETLFIWGWVIFDMQTHFDMLISFTTITFVFGKAAELQLRPTPPCAEDSVQKIPFLGVVVAS